MGSFGNVEVIEGRKYLGSFHHDILQAHPTDEASQRNLVEEIKNRAKGSIQVFVMQYTSRVICL